jgi:ATP-binding protein involved in chromosome partitioning
MTPPSGPLREKPGVSLDPRPSVIGTRFSKIKRTIAVTGWKGGIGKSVTASTLALLLAEKGFKTGLLDLDLAGASDHIVLGAESVFPKERMGLEPPLVSNVKFMSVSFFSRNKAVPLRGADVSDAIIELLAITQWGELDFLVIDMPPGINDTALDVIRLLPRTEVLAVTTPSVLANSVLARSLKLYHDLKVPVLGVIENMCARSGSRAENPASRLRYDAGLEKALGKPGRILKTKFAGDLRKAAAAILY